MFQEVTAENIRDDYDSYLHFMDEYGPRLVGLDKFNSVVAKKTPEQWMTRSLEAFGLVTLENYHETVSDSVYKSQPCPTPAKFTVFGTAKRNQGYKQEGLTRHRKLGEMVDEGRKKNKEYGEKYLKEKQEEMAEKGNRGKKRKLEAAEEREKGWENPLNDWDGIEATAV